MSTPRLFITGTRDDPDATEQVARVTERVVDAGLSVAVVAIGADREGQDAGALAQCTRATDRAVQRVDPVLSSANEVRATLARVGAGADLVLVIAPSRDLADRALEADGIEAQIGAPSVVCSDLDGAPLERVLELARSAEPLAASPPPDAPPRRARIAIAIDACFVPSGDVDLDLLEAAGAELVPLALTGDAERRPTLDPDDGDIDGLVIGDGHIERWSDVLARARGVRAFVRTLAGSGVPVLATGGGFAYLTRGVRTPSGALHPMAGVIDAEAVVLPGVSQRGHVEVRTRRESILGPAGLSLRGWVQRDWLVRGVRQGERAVYSTIGGPPDDGYANGNVFGAHFRVHWATARSAARFGAKPALGTFVDRCVSFAAAREYGARMSPGAHA